MAKSTAIAKINTQLNGTYDFMRDRLATFLGFSHNHQRDLYAAFGYERLVPTELLQAMYQRNDIANRIIKAYPSATWRKPPVIRDDAGDSAEEGSSSFSPFTNAVEDLFDKHRIYHFVQRGDRLSGIGRFGCLFLGFNDGKAFDQPLEEGMSAPLLYITPYSELQTTINEFELNQFDPRYGKPKFYTFQQGATFGEKAVQTKSIRVHWTRVLHLSEDVDSNDVYGTPRLLPVYNRLKDLEKVAGGSSEVYWLNARSPMVITADKDADLSAAALTDMSDQAKEFEHQLRRVMAFKGATVAQLQATVEDPSMIMDKLLDLIAGTCGIPKRILIGSERGELSSEQDENNWVARIDERRTHFATPMVLQPLVTKLIQTQNLPEPEGKWWVEWPTETALNAETAARIGQTRGATLQAYLSTPGSDMIVPPQEFRTDFLGLPPESEYDTPAEDEVLPEIDPTTGEPIMPPEEPVPDDEPPPADVDQQVEDDAEEDDEDDEAMRQPKLAANAAPKSLYVRRQVLNAKDIIAWAKKQGFKTTLKPEDMHVTIAYSKTPLDWMAIGPAWAKFDASGNPVNHYIIPEGGPRVVETFGQGAVVLEFNDVEISWRHEAICTAGASWDHPQYQPHITITWKKGDVDLDGVEPYQGEIVLGPEIFEEICEDWQSTLVENKRAKKGNDQRVRAAGNNKGRSKSRVPAAKGNRGNTRKGRSDKRATRYTKRV